MSDDNAQDAVAQANEILTDPRYVLRAEDVGRRLKMLGVPLGQLDKTAALLAVEDLLGKLEQAQASVEAHQQHVTDLEKRLASYESLVEEGYEPKVMIIEGDEDGIGQDSAHG